MAVLEHSINDGDGRYASRSRINRLVYEFPSADLIGLSSVSADVPLNGQIHQIAVDATRCILSSAAANTGSFQLLMGDLADGAGTPAQYRYHELITGMDYSAASLAPYVFQTSEGAATSDGTAAFANHLVVRAGVSSGGPPPMTVNAAGAQAMMDDVVPWTGLVCGSVRIALATVGNTFHAVAAGSIRVVIIYQ